jgi:hypothetical protein
MTARAPALVLAWLGSPRALVGIVALGLALRLLALALLARYPLVSDALSYHQTALQLRRGEAFLPYWPPGLPLYLASVAALLGESELAARAAILVFFIAGALLLNALVRLIATTRAANLATLLFALSPSAIHLSVEPLTQLPVAAGLTGIAYLALLLARSPRVRTSLALGGLLGWVSLTRPSSLLLAVAVPAYLALRARSPWRAAIPLLPAAVLIAAWMLLVYARTSTIVPINYANSQNLFFGNNASTPLYRTWWLGSHKAGEPGVPDEFSALLRSIQQQPLPVQESRYRQLALDHIRARPDLFVVRSLSRLRAFFALDTYSGAMAIKDYRLPPALGYAAIAVEAAIYGVVMVLALVCIANSARFGLLGSELVILLGIALLYALPYWLAFSHPGYRFPVLPLLGALAAIPAVALLERSQPLAGLLGSPGRRAILLAALLGLLLIQVEWVLVMLDRL